MDQFSPPPLMDARRVRSRKALRDALLVLLEEKAFEQITIREITAKAAVGYATFFRHFTTKDDLLNDLAAGQISELLGLATPVLKEANSRDAVRTLCTYVDQHRTLWAALLTGGASGTVREEFIRQAQMLERAGHYPPPRVQHWLPGDLPVVYATGATIDVLAWWLAQEVPYPIEEIAQVLDELVITPILRGTPLDPEFRDSHAAQA